MISFAIAKHTFEEVGDLARVSTGQSSGNNEQEGDMHFGYSMLEAGRVTLRLFFCRAIGRTVGSDGRRL